MLSLLLILGLNALVSTANAYSAGMTWRDRHAGPFVWLLSWSAVIQSAIGFSSILIFAGAYGLHATGHLPPRAMQAAISLWYLAVIVPALGTGLLILIHSWMVAFRERSLSGIGTAVYNTGAMAHNVYGASQGLGSAFSAVFDFVSSPGGDDSEDGAWILSLVLGLVAVSLGGGIVLTVLVMRLGMRRAPAFALS